MGVISSKSGSAMAQAWAQGSHSHRGSGTTEKPRIVPRSADSSDAQVARVALPAHSSVTSGKSRFVSKASA